MCSNLADTSSWDGMAGVPPYKPGQAAGYSAQQQNEEWATTLRRRSTSKIRGRVDHCGTCQAKQSADFSLAGREAPRFWAKSGAFEQSTKILSKEQYFWTKCQDFEQSTEFLEKSEVFRKIANFSEGALFEKCAIFLYCLWQCCGSGSPGSTCFGASRIRIH